MTFATRRAIEYWGFIKPLPDNVAYAERTPYSGLGVEPTWKVTTWEEIHKRRREKQEAILDSKRTIDIVEWKPCLVWVFYNHQSFPFHGYYCYIRTLKEDYAVNFRNPLKNIQEKLMGLFPLPGLLNFSNDFYDWMENFAEYYKKPSKKKKRSATAIAHCCIKNRGFISEEIIDIKL